MGNWFSFPPSLHQDSDENLLVDEDILSDSLVGNGRVGFCDNILSSEEISEILSLVPASTVPAVHHVYLPKSICDKLNEYIGCSLKPYHTVPLTSCTGDVPSHVDVEIANQPFDHTYLMYLSDSPGSLVVQQTSFPIKKGRCYLFDQGMEHQVVDTDMTMRWMLGPMTATGTKVGATTAITYVSAPGDDATVFGLTYYDNGVTKFEGMDVIVRYYPEARPPYPNNRLLGWYVFSAQEGSTQIKVGDFVGIGAMYTEPYSYWVTPVWGADIPPPVFGPAALLQSGKALYSDNSRVFYKPHTSGGIGGSRNSRAKARKT